MPLPSLLLRIVLCLSLALNGVATALASTPMHDCCDGAALAMDMHVGHGHDQHHPHAASACTCAGFHPCTCWLPAASTAIAIGPARGPAAAPVDAHPAPNLQNLLRPPIGQV